MNVLIIDDEKNIRLALSTCLNAAGYKAFEAPNLKAALTAMDETHFDAAFLDLRLGQENGLAIIPQLLAKNSTLHIIIITAFATFETAVEATKRGAFDYLPKPFSPDQIRHVMNQVSEALNLKNKLENLEEQLKETCPEANFETQSPKMKKALEMTKQAANSSAAVLFRGESGSGKSLFARLLHASSPRSTKKFITVNCPILQEGLLASELFGFVKGSFTGAVKDQPGKVEVAHGGTLFLDEIGEMPTSLQAKLLRFLQEKQFERIGETISRKSDARIVCASNRNLEEDVKSGKLREDLLFRINIIEITIPPLRERPEDILPIANGFLGFFSKELGRPRAYFSAEFKNFLKNYNWPGNIRELRNLIERTLIIFPQDEIGLNTLPEKMQTVKKEGYTLGGDHSLEEIEREHILKVLRKVPTLEEAAKILNIDVSTLWRKRKKIDENL
ncbi:MAG: sigma-54-dependent Fis family transcriptional regulator [Candidatus Riflebacteria bacterium]|nr:sigma-54-dependent Fis family transcriptional regulator [Candidatus Riflebacteria bacterium]